MSKVWLVAEQHFRQEVLKRSFLFVMLSLPAFLVLIVGIGFLSERLYEDSYVVGYVDPGGFLLSVLDQNDDADVELRVMESEDAARVALEEGAIDAYYLLPASYPDDADVQLIYDEPVGWSARNRFRNLVRRNLLAGQPAEVVERAMPGSDLTVRATAYNREFPDGGPSAGQIVSVVVGVLFAVLAMVTSGYLMGMLIEEKENRTMEIIVSSVSPQAMMLGKVLAGVGLGLVLLAVWTVFLVGAVFVGRDVLEMGWLQNIDPNWRDVLSVIAVAIPVQLVISSAMSIVGALVSNQQEADQIGPFVFLIMMVPLYLLLPISKDPNSALSIGLSLFPPTSVLTIAFRSLFREIPLWQVAASVGVSLASAAALIWLSAKAFRASMLRYGQRLRWSEILGLGRGA
jgi:ABC-2 type transport system permease protein